MNYRIICSMFVVLVLLLTSCPGGQDDEAKVPPADTTTMKAPVSADSPVQPDEDAAADDGEQAAEAVEPEEEEQEPEPPAKPQDGDRTQGSNPEVTGLWFALFSQDSMGKANSYWDNGHRLEFFKNGQALWSMVVNGNETETMDSQWRQTKDGIVLSFAASRAVESGISSIAPVGIGKDEEIGLASSSVGDMNTSAMSLFEARLNTVIEQNYLVLKDMQGRLTVYGRAPTRKGPHEAPDLSGNWQGRTSKQDSFPAEFTWNSAARTLSGSFANGREQFNGSYTGRYFVGEVIGMNGIAAVALTLTEDNELDGIYCHTTTWDIDTVYEFSREQ